MNSSYTRLIARGRIAATPVVIVTAATVVGIMLSTPGASAKAAHAAGGSISKTELAKLRTFVAAQQEAPRWVAPGPAVNGEKALKGKTIVTFPVSSGIDACNFKGQQGYFDKEASALGAKIDALTSPAGPPSWISNLNAAVADHASAVVMLCGVSAAVVKNQLVTLKKDRIPVVAGTYGQTGGSPQYPYTGLSAETGENTAGGVRTGLADALVNLKGKPAHVLFLDSNQVASYLGAADALNAAIKQWCPRSCSVVKAENFPTQEWSGPTETSEVTSDLQANRSINTVIVAYDGMTDGIESTIASEAATHPGLKMYAWGTGLAEVKDVQSSSTFVGDAGPNNQWDAYNQLDQTIRLLSHRPAVNVNGEVPPNVFFTKSNAASYSVGGKGLQYSNKAYGNGAFVKDFLKLWEVTK